MSERTPAIAWQLTQHNSHHGRVGKIKLFVVSFGFDKNSETPWNLHSELPGMKKVRAYATVDEAKADAERLVRVFLAHLVEHGVAQPSNAE